MFSLNTKISILKALITKKSPFYIQFFITPKCNLKCKMCNIVAAYKNKEEISLDGIQKIAKNLRKIGAGIVLLTGGEPFLRRDIPEIVNIMKSEKLDVRLQTHGFKTNRELIKACLENGATDINISLDSINEELQDSINQITGSWRHAIETISYITQTFPTKNKICAFGCVLSKYNYKEIPQIIRFATKIGWYVSLVPVHINKNGESMLFRSYDSSFMFNEEFYPELDKLFVELKRMKRSGYYLFDSDAYLDSSLEFIKTGKPTWRVHNICDSPFLYFAINPSGDFAPCCDHSYEPKLSVADPDFPKIYKSQSFINNVLKITQTCPGCQFGSYPEMTLMTRNPSSFLEKSILFFNLSHKGIRKLSYEDVISELSLFRSQQE